MQRRAFIGLEILRGGEWASGPEGEQRSPCPAAMLEAAQ